MGIFDRWKKRKTASSDSKCASSHTIQNVGNFYADCIKAFHDEAAKNGLAKRGLIYIPELIEAGNKTILAFLQDPFFVVEFGQNPTQYYYAIMSLSLQAGICFGEKWHTALSELKNGYVDRIIEEGPADEADRIFKSTIGLPDSQQQNHFYQVIFEKWVACHEPYWALTNPREYTFHAMLAAYQLGISIILEKYGL